MRKLLYCICIALLLGLPAAAQFTVVTGTVTDPNGLPYALGTITVQLVLAGTTPTLNGGSFSMSGSAGLDKTGSFTMRLADSLVMVPNSNWSFTVCSGQGTIPPAGGSGSVCFTAAPITITGGAQSITSQLTAAALALSNQASKVTLSQITGPTVNLAPGTGTLFTFAIPGTNRFSLSDGSGNFIRFNAQTNGLQIHGWDNSTINVGDSGFPRIELQVPAGGNDITVSTGTETYDFADSGVFTTGAFSNSWRSPSFASVGSKFTASGCSNSTLLGGASVGSYHSGTTGTCTVVITLGAGVQAAPNGWACWANDLTTPADVQHQTATTGSTVTISGTTVSGDVINFGCIAY